MSTIPGSDSLWPLLVVLLLTIWLGWSARRWRRQTGLPEGEVIYTDTAAWFSNDEVLHSEDLRLAGKPDYLVEQADGSIIPVELKSGGAPAEPWEGHVLQLAAYCLLVHEHFGIRPECGILQYQDKAFAIDYTEDLEEDLLDLLAEMRESTFGGDLDRDHNDWGRCAKCDVRQHCYQRLA